MQLDQTKHPYGTAAAVTVAYVGLFVALAFGLKATRFQHGQLGQQARIPGALRR